MSDDNSRRKIMVNLSPESERLARIVDAAKAEIAAQGTAFRHGARAAIDAESSFQRRDKHRLPIMET
jgi:hypothetical protein